MGININSRQQHWLHCSFPLHQSQTLHCLLSDQSKTTRDPSEVLRATGMLSTPKALLETEHRSNLHGNEERWRLRDYRVIQQVKDVFIKAGTAFKLCKDSKAAKCGNLYTWRAICKLQQISCNTESHPMQYYRRENDIIQMHFWNAAAQCDWQT